MLSDTEHLIHRSVKNILNTTDVDNLHNGGLKPR